jgi:protein involved in polysaccharide export with SLBB domain
MPRPFWCAVVLAALLLGADAYSQQPNLGNFPANLPSTLQGTPVLPQQPVKPQLPEPGSKPALEGAVDDSVYVVGPGDQFVLGIWGVNTLNLPLQVDLEGNLFIPELGVMPVAGRTLAAVRREIKDQARRYYPRSEITLSLVEGRKFRVFLAGHVVHPGGYTLSGSDRVSQLIELAGPLPDSASTRNIEIARKNGNRVRVDLERFYRLGDLSADPFLWDGDRVVVPYRRYPVEVYGAVQAPGIYEYVEGERAGSLIELSGGLTVDAAADTLTVVHVAPDGVTTRSETVLFPEEDPTLAPRDQVFVRTRPARYTGPVVTLRGEFHHPMSIPIVEGKARLGDALRAVGGFTENAAIDEATLTRTGTPSTVVDTTFQRLARIPVVNMTPAELAYYKMKLQEPPGVMRLDFRKVLQDPSAPDNVLLERGDLIQAPARRNFVQVSGKVAKPGSFVFDSDYTVDEYIERAGGYSRDARKSHVTLIRAEGGQWIRQPGSDVRPEPGDIIWVPEKPERSYWQSIRDVASLSVQVVTLVILARRL